MKHVLKSVVLISALALSTMRAVASPEIDKMSDIEVAEYAVQMSQVLGTIQSQKLCGSQDMQCLRDEFSRKGVSYDDKASVQKRLVLIIGKVY